MSENAQILDETHDVQTDQVTDPVTDPVDPVVDSDPVPPAQPQTDPMAETLKLLNQAQQQNAELNRRLTEKTAPPVRALKERLIERGIKEETAAIISEALAEAQADFDERYIGKQFEGVMAQAFLDSRERSATETISEQYDLQPDELKSVRGALDGIRQQYGNVPMELAMKAAVADIRGKAPRQPANDPMRRPAAPPHRGAPPAAKGWQDYSMDDWEKLSDEQKDNLLRKKRA